MRALLKNQYFVWISISIWWVILAAFFQNNPVTEIIHNLLVKHVSSKPGWIHVFNLIEIIGPAILGLVLAGYFTTEYLKKIAKKTFDESIETMGTEAQTQAYYSYLTIINHTQEMKNLVNKLVKLPRHPELLKILIEDYSKKANDSKFLVDFSTFLKLAGILVDNSEEMYFVNITPPYEWWHPVKFERNEDKQKAIKDYKEKIEIKIKQGKRLERITILEEEKALTSILEYNCTIYFRHYGIDMLTTPHDKLIGIDETIIKPLLEWFETLLKQHSTGITNYEDQKLTTALIYILEILGKRNSTSVKFIELMNYCWDIKNNKFSDSFFMLSDKLSKLILKDFCGLNNPKDRTFYVFGDRVSMEKKDDINNMKKEEGIFKDSNGNTYLLRTEEANGLSVLLVSVKRLEYMKTSHFNSIMQKFINAKVENGATGRITDYL